MDAARQVGMTAVHYRQLSDLRELVAPVLGEVRLSLSRDKPADLRG